MNRQQLIIITGPPGAGKTTLGRRLAADLNLPFFSKDEIKEILFDNLGWENRLWSQKLGGVSFEMLFYMITAPLAAGQSLLVETAFHPKFHNQRFLALQTQYNPKTVQIYCQADTQIMFDRFHNRATGGERHPGHVDHLGTYEEFRATIESAKYAPLEIGGSLLKIDLTDFNRIDYPGLLAKLRAECI
jgi:predicted kinase